MNYFFFILTQNILPIFLQIGIGVIIQKKFKLSIMTMSKVQIYVLLPALLFSSIYSNDINSDVIFQIIVTNIICYGFLAISSIIMSKALRLDKMNSKSFANSLILSNQGNYLIPLLGLIFIGENATYAIALQLMVMLIQTFVLNTFGIYNASGGHLTKKDMIKRFFGLPVLYVFLAAVFFRVTHIPLWNPVMTSINIIGKSFVTVALLTLGMQLAETKLHVIHYRVFISNLIKLVLTPAVVLGCVLLLGYEGIVAKVLIISAAAPSAVNSVLWAIEFGGDAEFASQTVLTSTILSTITMTLVIQIITHIF